MKVILFIGTHRKLLSNEIFTHHDNSRLSYYLYETNGMNSDFSFWTWSLEKVIASNYKKLEKFEY